MTYAQVILDIATRALERAYDYAVPPELASELCVGTTVLVTFANRAAVGYVVGLTTTPPQGVAHVRSIEQVLAPSAFDEVAARVAAWMADEYACSPADAIHPFLAPGQKVRVTRSDNTSPWELVNERAGAVDVRWVALTKEGASFKAAKNASRQREVIKALTAGAMRLSELSATIPGASAVVKSLEKKGVCKLINKRNLRGEQTTTLSSALAPKPTQLTAGQEEALAAIEKACLSHTGDVVLIDGVTGSGKTEVYLRAIERVRSRGKGALVLVPEISLTAQTLGRFRSRFGDDVAVLHSRLSTGERFDQWDLARTGQVHVVVGARSALFAPLKNIGLIIIDEEHEASYKQDQSPRYHAREVAAKMAQEFGAALVLGSATPSLESLARCKAGNFNGVSWTRVSMPERPGGAVLPKVTVVDMAREFNSGSHSIFSRPLQESLTNIVKRKEKAVLLLNRRGFANFLMCRECGCVPECPHCSTSLTYHERTHALVCHTCDRSWSISAYPNPLTRCPNCGSRYLAAFGVGTQRVEDELHALLPANVDIIRMDWDTTRTKGAHQKLLETFDASECAVLIGTQMIAKGLDFPEVTLVGVINADTMLKLPDFRAPERTYALLEQVSGRAGRGERPGEVIVQSWWASHASIQAAAHHNRNLFVDAELIQRSEANYPPYARLSNALFWGNDAQAVRETSAEFAQRLSAYTAHKAGWEVLGPADCIKSKVKDQTRRHVMLKSPADSRPGVVFAQIARAMDKRAGIKVALDIDAYDLM